MRTGSPAIPLGVYALRWWNKVKGSADRVRVHGHEGRWGAYIVRVHHTGDVHVHPRGSLNELCMVQAYERCVELSSTLCEADATFQEESGSAGASGTTTDVFQISIRRLDLPLIGGEERHPPHLDKVGWVSVLADSQVHSGSERWYP